MDAPEAVKEVIEVVAEPAPVADPVEPASQAALKPFTADDSSSESSSFSNDPKEEK